MTGNLRKLLSALSVIVANTDNDLVQKRQNQSADCEHADDNANLIGVRDVINNSAENGGRETTKGEAKTLVDPAGQEDQEQTSEESLVLLAPLRDDEQGNADESADRCHPHEGPKLIDAIKTKEQVLDGGHMMRAVGIEAGKDLKQEEEEKEQL